MQTDALLRSAIIGEMSLEPSLDILRIDVQVTNGVVYLDGQLKCLAQKNVAESVANRVTGRSAVVTRLRIDCSRLATVEESWVSEVRRSVEHDVNRMNRIL